MNDILAAFCLGHGGVGGLASDFRRVSSKANVADAISRGDLSTAHRMGWTRVQTPVSSILKDLGGSRCGPRLRGQRHGRRAGQLAGLRGLPALSG